MIKLFAKVLKDPKKAMEVINRRYFQFGLTTKEPEIAVMKTWVYGKLKREKLNQIFPGIENQNYCIINGFNRTDNMSMTLLEVNVVAAIVSFLKAKRIFEIGTFDGGTTVNLAANTSEDAVVYTADLPDSFDDFKLKISSVSDNKSEHNNVGVQYKNSAFIDRIKQIFEDSASIDYSKLNPPYDLFFIDGCHDYTYVKADTENALKYTRKGGVIIWHDYGMIKDVSDYVDEIADKHNIRVIRGCRLAVCIVN